MYYGLSRRRIWLCEHYSQRMTWLKQQFFFVSSIIEYGYFINIKMFGYSNNIFWFVEPNFLIDGIFSWINQKDFFESIKILMRVFWFLYPNMFVNGVFDCFHLKICLTKPVLEFFNCISTTLKKRFTWSNNIFCWFNHRIRLLNGYQNICFIQQHFLVCYTKSFDEWNVWLFQPTNLFDWINFIII